jgi:hypothetical protein
VGLERGRLSLVSTIEELLERQSSVSGSEDRDYGLRDPPRRPRSIICPQKLALTSATCGTSSVGIFRSRTQAIEFFYEFMFLWAILYFCVSYKLRDSLYFVTVYVRVAFGDHLFNSHHVSD